MFCIYSTRPSRTRLGTLVLIGYILGWGLYGVSIHQSQRLIYSGRMYRCNKQIKQNQIKEKAKATLLKIAYRNLYLTDEKRLKATKDRIRTGCTSTKYGQKTKPKKQE